MPLNTTVTRGAPEYEALCGLAVTVGQMIAAPFSHALESVLLATFEEGACTGFLRVLISLIGEAAGRPPLQLSGEAPKEGYVEAFAVKPDDRRRGLGQALPQTALDLCAERGATSFTKPRLERRNLRP